MADCFLTNTAATSSRVNFDAPDADCSQTPASPVRTPISRASDRHQQVGWPHQRRRGQTHRRSPPPRPAAAGSATAPATRCPKRDHRQTPSRDMRHPQCRIRQGCRKCAPHPLPPLRRPSPSASGNHRNSKSEWHQRQPNSSPAGITHIAVSGTAVHVRDHEIDLNAAEMISSERRRRGAGQRAGQRQGQQMRTKSPRHAFPVQLCGSQGRNAA